MHIIYSVNSRIPSEKAHPYQISQMCEAFAQAGSQVTLIYPNRRNSPELQNVSLFDHYQIEEVFAVKRIPVLDLFSLTGKLPGRIKKISQRFAIAMISLIYYPQFISAISKLPDIIIYSRDPIILFLLTVLFPNRSRQLFFEAHTYPASRLGVRIRCWLANRIGGIIVITDHLRQRYQSLGFPPERILVAHDAIRTARFDIGGTRSDWRQKLGWPEDSFIVGYVGRFQTLGMDKGVGDLVQAVIMLNSDNNRKQVQLGLVGGPEQYVDQIRQSFVSVDLSHDIVLYAGQVSADQVPGYLAAFDVCAMPFPWTKHFAFYASPMKLFEYMASGSAIVATDLPSTREIIRDGENGLLTPPSDPPALAAALRRLRDDPDLGDRLAKVARAEVFSKYTWKARAENIIVFIERTQTLTDPKG